MAVKTKRLYTSDDGISDYIHVQYKDARWPVSFIGTLDRHFVGISKQGLPWKCLLVKMVKAAAEADPHLFQHPVLYGYAEGTTLYIITQKARRARELHHAVRYRHNFTKILRRFDTFTKQRFLDHFGEQGVEIKLYAPARSSPRTGERAGERAGAGTGVGVGTREPRTPRQGDFRGAHRRALDAGLVPLD
jgi:hypothetical protein